ncbi:DUF4082 domain-containing protein [Nakamurella lactea]|uniref:DUF4082 domain-containing protein n=1 Tax=Nakamurella lactea TaxID=459515 RepID=UPI000684D711|nr:DUF4082 domain-containing protein [Nakamurella lactea]
MTRSAFVRPLSILTVAGMAFWLIIFVAPAAQAATCTGNAVYCENQLPGTPEDVWDVDGAGDDSIQGFATQISVNHGQTVQFKITTDAPAYRIEIYRLGYYQGDGARLVDTVNPTASLAHNQPACATDESTEIYDCGTWRVSASWAVPAAAVSGVYIANLVRTDDGGQSHIPFIVRDDSSHSQIVYQTSDPTWQAYNTYGGSDFYVGQGNGRAYKVSYNRPFATRGWEGGRDFLFSNEYPMIRFLEANGYDLSYISGLDTDIRGNLLTNHKAFLSVGHDEYWSAGQRTNVENARDAGVNLAFFSGNEVYWKTRWEPSEDGNNTANRTLVCYKDTWANAPIDPVEATATWRDPRFGGNGHGPENALTGTMYMSNFTDLPITVSADEGKFRLWRNTALASQPAGTSTALAAHTIGYESDEDIDNGSRPAGLVRLSTTTGPTPQYLQDFGSQTGVAPGTTTHHLTMYKAPSGALVFGAGTVQWAWGLDSDHDGTATAADPRMQQATVNLLADMGAGATSLIAGLSPASKSTDTTGPTSTITAPAPNSAIPQGSLITVTGTASDSGGGRVAGVEVSVDGGLSWHPASGTSSYSYTGIVTGTGAQAVRVRATDDSGNTQAVPTNLPLTVNCPCSLFGASVPTTPSADDSDAVTIGMNFTSSADGFITGLRFYKGAGNTGTHVGTLYAADGTVLSTVTFKDETATGWQTATFPSAVPVSAGANYVAAYRAPNGHYSADARYFAARSHSAGVLTAPGGPTNLNGVFATGNGMPDTSWDQTNYYVDVIYSATDTTPLSVATVTPLDGSTSVPVATAVSATFSRAIDQSSIDLTVATAADHQPVAGAVSYNATTRKVTFTPTQSLSPGVAYTARLNASAPGVGPMPAPETWTFTSAKAPETPGVCPCTLFDDGDVPAGASAADPDSVELGTAFTVDTAGQITGVRYFKASDNPGAHPVSLWNSAGTRLATATAAQESTDGWQQATFATPVDVVPGQTYTASYRAPQGHYSVGSGGLVSPISRSPLHTANSAGRYTYGTGAPTSTSQTNFYVDPVFNVDPAAAPQVASVDPGNGATSVPSTATVTVSFATQIQPGSALITVTDGNGAAVVGAASQESIGSALTFVPATPLLSGTTYTVKVSGAKSLAGTPMSAPSVTSFTTSGATACPCSLFSSTLVPALSDSGDAGAVTVGLRFTAQSDGFISGLKYYRDGANTGTHTGALYTADGTKLASLTFTEQPPGWQTAQFSTPVAITGGTTYVASSFMPTGHYSVALDYFDQPVTNTPLTGLTGTYRYGSDAFPNSTYNNSNYYVDVVFKTDNTTPPQITSLTPAAGSTAEIDAPVTATFARAIDPQSLTFTVTASGGGQVSGGVAYNAATRTATFTPTTALAYGTSFTASVSAASASGVAMAEPKTWTFASVPAPPPGTASSIWSDSATPDTPAWNDSDSVALGIRFTSDKAGMVTAVKFYAGPGNTGPQPVAIWDATGAKIGSGQSTSTDTGWRSVRLDTPVPITVGATYTASYTAPHGHYAVTSGGLAAGIDSGYLHIPAGGGVYNYPGNAFPTNASLTNFWVDIVLVVPNDPADQAAANRVADNPTREPESTTTAVTTTTPTSTGPLTPGSTSPGTASSSSAPTSSAPPAGSTAPATPTTTHPSAPTDDAAPTASSTATTTSQSVTGTTAASTSTTIISGSAAGNEVGATDASASGNGDNQ